MSKPTNHIKTITNRSKPTESSKKSSNKFFISLTIVILLLGIGAYYLNQKRLNAETGKIITQTSSKLVTKTSTKSTIVAAPSQPITQVSTACKSNTSSQFVLVSISERHMWACDGSSQIYDSAVITGIEYLPADLTPTGTYYVYTKEQNLYLKGCDNTGCWNDYVNYYLPFLRNQYGTYGFHDATWRDPEAFGNISPDSSDASHGCVELPLATATWLFNWANVGLKVTIEA